MIRYRRLSLIAASTALAVFCTIPLHAEQLIVNPTSDGYAVGTTDLNFTRLRTTDTQLVVYRFDSQTDQRPLFEFDASTLPEGALVTGASLEINVAFFQTATSANIMAFPGDAGLTLADATAPAEQVGALGLPTATGPRQIPLAVDGVLGNLSSTNGLVTIRMQAPASGVFFAIYAIEDSLAARRPRLVIDYELPPPPPPLEVLIDVLPESSTNSLNLKRKTDLPVAVFGSAEFDATTLDESTAILFDPLLEGAIPAHASSASVEDVNQDGLPDLVLTFPMAELLAGALDAHTAFLELQGRTTSPRDVFGGDVVAIKGGSGKGGGKGNGNGK